ncbi:hypothetical protein IWQ62_003533 [Dispira parvispora]|uniref:Uncharacterized protein n=1 Tax=Dispira parvispora TaxID=1520584 RepID=A0A9W8AU02_9FUNG|nr:hypothetical protein IWQ62_003533 [Dispira parvispora]
MCDTSFQFVLKELQPEFTKLNDFFLELRGALFDWDGQEATYFKETDCRPKKRRQISIPDGIDSGTANQRFMEAMMERYKQKKKIFIAKESARNEKYFERLISRGGQADTILEMFIDIIEDYIPIFDR